MMLLSEIIGKYPVKSVIGRTDHSVSGLCLDSRKAVAGSLFFAVPGTASDGHDFIGSAIEKGASAVVCERLPEHADERVTWVVVEKSQTALGWMASAFHGDPSRKLKLVGVTGTNGKTTTATLLYELLTALGFKSGLISTILNKICATEFPATHTTPDPISLNELLARMTAEGCEYCFMEVSSHAIAQDRIAGLHFAGGIFTNLTHDHLDYLGTFDDYLKAKKTFFDNLPETAFALVNKDDKTGMVMVQNTKATRFTYSLRSMADFRCRILENQFDGMLLEIDEMEVWFRLIGTFDPAEPHGTCIRKIQLCQVGQWSYRHCGLRSYAGCAEKCPRNHQRHPAA